PESFTVTSWRRNFMPYLLCVRVADKCFEALWIEGVACHQSTKGSSAAAPPPRFLVVSSATRTEASFPGAGMNVIDMQATPASPTTAALGPGWIAVANSPCHQLRPILAR